MKVKWIWMALFLAGALIALYFNGVLFYELYRFLKLSSLTSATVEKWEVKELSPSKFALFAHYTFEVKEKTYEGTTVYSHPVFPNGDAAKFALKEMPVTEKVYYASSNPQTSSLQRDFPMNTLFRAVLGLGIFLYFFWLRTHLSRQFSEQQSASRMR